MDGFKEWIMIFNLISILQISYNIKNQFLIEQCV